MVFNPVLQQKETKGPEHHLYFSEIYSTKRTTDKPDKPFMNWTLPVTKEEIRPPRLWAHRLTDCAILFKTPIPAPNMDRVHPHSDGSRLVPTAAIQAVPISIAI